MNSENSHTEPRNDQPSSGETRHRILTGPLHWIVVAGALGSVFLAINQLFNFGLLGKTLIDPEYLYLLSGIFLGIVFLLVPATKNSKRDAVPLYDVLLCLAAFSIALFFALTSSTSLNEGWEYFAPVHVKYLSFAFYFLVLEGTRRTGGTVIFGLVLLLSLYPVVADKMPGPISGFPQPFAETVTFHVVSSESAFGIPMRAFGQLVVGFILFGAALQHTGGGRFFNDLAFALVGRYRGGAGKVAIFASGFMGSMSGSVISNVLTTGVVSIPAMKRTGFAPQYAAGTEACASTGGVLMPPVMGTTAFVMASFLGIPYSEILLAAAIPSILYYFGLFVQLDAYAGRNGLKGLKDEELPSVRSVFAEGWQYLVVFAVLIFFLLVRRQETLAPFYATGLLLVITQVMPATRMSPARIVDLIVAIGKSLAELVAILLGVGMIVGAFSATGLTGTLVNDLVFLADREVFPLLIMGAVTAFIFGMGMTVTACYIFLAIVLAPALTQLGLNPLSVHLFILYWGMVSFITPPVALGAFAGATIAGTSPMKAGVSAMRLGSVIYFIPFFFVLNPALIGQGPLPEVAWVFATALVGIYFLGAAMQGYIPLIGALPVGALGMILRIPLFFGGIAFAVPGDIGIGVNSITMLLIATALSAPGVLVSVLSNRSQKSQSVG